MEANSSPKQQLSERLKQANNVLVTVSNNPSVDQLAACIGLTIVLNHMGKHATAVFSGIIPSTIEFLKPETTLEKTTDSLRDFIIALDKSKADKLRYKVEDKVVKIFITPYRSSINQDDLNFSQGDFNVDVVVALGVHQQTELDAAITEHGRILHDATVATVNTAPNGELGSINWVEPSASSLSELVTILADGLDKTAFDSQMATALLTGIVAATDRFSNNKTTPSTMSVSAQLMSAGANQQLIATELAVPAPSVAPQPSAVTSEGQQQAQPSSEPTSLLPKKDSGELDIDHPEGSPAGQSQGGHPQQELNPQNPQIHIDEHGRLTTPSPTSGQKPSQAPASPFPEISKVRSGGSSVPEGSPTTAEGLVDTPKPDEEWKRERIVETPSWNGSLTANAAPQREEQELGSEELTLPSVDMPILNRAAPASARPFPPPPQQSSPPPMVAPSGPPVIEPGETLTDIERSVNSPHATTSTGTTSPNVDDARSAVEAALSASSAPPPEIPKDLNALPLGPDLHDDPSTDSMGRPDRSPINPGFSEPTPGSTPADESLDMPLPPSTFAAPQPPSDNRFQAPQAFPPSSFSGSTPPSGEQPPSTGIPPVPPPFIPPLQ